MDANFTSTVLAAVSLALHAYVFFSQRSVVQSEKERSLELSAFQEKIRAMVLETINGKYVRSDLFERVNTAASQHHDDQMKLILQRLDMMIERVERIERQLAE